MRSLRSSGSVGGVVRPSGRAALSRKQPPSRPWPGKDMDETSLRAIRMRYTLSTHPAARQRYTGLTVVLFRSPSSSLVPEAVREVIGGEPGMARADPA
jgi:hypothetical protein